MKHIISTLLLLVCLTTAFAQTTSSDTSIIAPNLSLESWQVSGYKILGGCIDWDSDIEFRKNRVAEYYDAPGSEGNGSFKQWKKDIPAFKIGCDSGNCINGIGKYIDSNANKYVGQFKDGKKNGFGKMTYHTNYGDYFYEGNWKDDKRDGFGKLGQTKNKEVPIFYFYIGEWKNNYWNGEGILVNDHDHGDDFYVYKGNFQKGFAIGKGTFIKLKTIADFEDEKLNSQLRSFWSQQSKRSSLKIENIPEALIIERYDGFFLGHHSLLEGYGTFFEYSNAYREKFTYTGIFDKGQIKLGSQLRQFLTTNDWTKTDGEWEISKNFHGLVFGREVMKNGQKYEGYFKDQKYNGHGKFTYSNILNGKREDEIPDVQIGIYKDGEYSKPLTSEETIELSKRIEEFENKLNNSLPLTSSDNPQKQNSVSQGKCISGNCNFGIGTFENGDGDTFSGQWKEGKQNGFGVYIRKSDGQKWEGEWKNNLWDGYGIYTYADGQILLGFWREGKIDENKKLDNFNNPFNKFDAQGKPDGLWITFFEESNSPYNSYVDNPYNIKNLGYYKNGIKDGRWLYYSNGQILREENYKVGIKHGKFIEYWGDGFAQYRRLRKIENYNNGELDGIYQEYTHFGNNLLLECNYTNGSKNGEEIEYYNIEYGYSDRSNLKAPIKVKRQYKFGKIDGDVLFYRQDGILSGKDRYKMGILEFSYTF